MAVCRFYTYKSPAIMAGLLYLIKNLEVAIMLKLSQLDEYPNFVSMMRLSFRDVIFADKDPYRWYRLPGSQVHENDKGKGTMPWETPQSRENDQVQRQVHKGEVCPNCNMVYTRSGHCPSCGDSKYKKKR
jgi:uncharacterized paraquat-inducible protein A